MAEQKKQSYLTGAAILAATVAITKVIGAVYKIPLYNLLGDEGTSHFQVIYNIYNLILTISTAGVPLAISRLIAGSRAVGQYGQARRYYTVSMMVFGLIGIMGTVAMFLFASPLAEFMNDPEAALGVRFLSPAVLCACVISVYRGYSQGHQDMTPTAISQIMEVLCKLIFGLAIALMLSRQGQDLATVAAGAIIGVTLGLAFAVPVMAFCKRRIARRCGDVISDTPMSRGRTAAAILKVSIPITLGASVLNIITLIDTAVVRGRLGDAGFGTVDVNVLYGVYSKGLTLFNIPSAFITPLVVAVAPAIAASVARRNHGETKATVESCMRVMNLIAMPMAVGLCVMAEPIFDVLYPGSNGNGPVLLAILGIASYFVCCYSVTNGVLQASGHERLALLALPIGGVVKIVMNYFLVGSPSVNIIGAPVGTLGCYVVITLLNLIFISAKLPSKPNFLKITVRPLVCTVIMGLTAWGVHGLAARFLLPLINSKRIGEILILGLAVLVAVVVYLVLAVALRAVSREDVLLLPRGEVLVQKFHIR